MTNVVFYARISMQMSSDNSSHEHRRSEGRKTEGKQYSRKFMCRPTQELARCYNNVGEHRFAQGIFFQSVFSRKLLQSRTIGGKY